MPASSSSRIAARSNCACQVVSMSMTRNSYNMAATTSALARELGHWLSGDDDASTASDAYGGRPFSPVHGREQSPELPVRRFDDEPTPATSLPQILGFC